MPLKLTFASEDAASRIADIHMAAFATNGMLLAQFPTSAIRDGLRDSIARKALDDIRDPHTAVLLVQDSELEGEIISFAKWSLPSSTSDNEAPWIWPEGTRFDILDQWTQRVEGAKSKVLGDEPCYRLAFIATDPDHQRRGAATMLIKWALDQCSKDKTSAYLESTPVAWALYTRLGFTPEEKISMTFPDKSSYKEVGFLCRPDKGVAS
ncbi:hypothetical protein MMC31_002665 [Peltigera leucophlebia]|nr:hypothetical protein [Peltigera leucophlebia]